MSTITFKCQVCLKNLDVFVNDCRLDRYSLEDVPLKIAAEIDGEMVECPNCFDVTYIWTQYGVQARVWS